MEIGIGVFRIGETINGGCFSVKPGRASNNCHRRRAPGLVAISAVILGFSVGCVGNGVSSQTGEAFSGADLPRCDSTQDVAFHYIRGIYQAEVPDAQDRVIFSERGRNVCYLGKGLSLPVDSLTGIDQRSLRSWSALNGAYVELRDSLVRINVEVLRDSIVHIRGDASYENAAGSVSVGYFAGSAHDPNSYSSALRVYGDHGDQRCFLDIKPLASWLAVLDSGKVGGRCGGSNATFTGIYKRALYGN